MTDHAEILAFLRDAVDPGRPLPASSASLVRAVDALEADLGRLAELERERSSVVEPKRPAGPEPTQANLDAACENAMAWRERAIRAEHREIDAQVDLSEERKVSARLTQGEAQAAAMRAALEAAAACLDGLLGVRDGESLPTLGNTRDLVGAALAPEAGRGWVSPEEAAEVRAMVDELRTIAEGQAQRLEMVRSEIATLAADSTREIERLTRERDEARAQNETSMCSVRGLQERSAEAGRNIFRLLDTIDAKDEKATAIIGEMVAWWMASDGAGWKSPEELAAARQAERERVLGAAVQCWANEFAPGQAPRSQREFRAEIEAELAKEGR